MSKRTIGGKEYVASNLPEDNFAMIPHYITRDPGIKPNAKMLLIFMIGCSPTFDINWKTCKRFLNIGRDAYYAAKNELEKLGFLHTEFKLKSGKVCGTKRTVNINARYDNITQLNNSLFTGKPETEMQETKEDKSKGFIDMGKKAEANASTGDLMNPKTWNEHDPYVKIAQQIQADNDAYLQNVEPGWEYVPKTTEIGIVEALRRYLPGSDSMTLGKFYESYIASMTGHRHWHLSPELFTAASNFSGAMEFIKNYAGGKKVYNTKEEWEARKKKKASKTAGAKSPNGNYQKILAARRRRNAANSTKELR